MIQRDYRLAVVIWLVLAMECCWLYTVLTMLNINTADGILSVFRLLGLFIFAYILHKAAVILKLTRWLTIPASVLLWAAVFLVLLKFECYPALAWSDVTWLKSIPQSFLLILDTFRPELLLLVASATLWWLGQRNARRSGSYTTVVTEFQFGILILVILFAINTQIPVPMQSVAPVVLLFFACGLSGIAVSGASAGATWFSGLNRYKWFWLMLLCILLILLVGFVVASIVTPDLLDIIWQGLKWVGHQIMRFIAWLASLFPPSEEPVEMPAMESMPATGEADTSRLWSIPERLRDGMQLGWGLFMAAFVLLAMWRVSSDVIAWLRGRFGGASDGEVEKLRGSVFSGLWKFLQKILRKLLRIRLPERHHRKEEYMPPEVRTVRQIYRQIIRRATAAGFPRQSAQTPDEYLLVLNELYPEMHAELAYVTSCYTATRYSSAQPDEEALQRLREYWHRIRKESIAKRDKNLS